jgi:hypothetical protein
MVYEDEPVGEIDYPKFDEYLNNTVFIIQDICISKKTFKAQLKEFYDFMKQGFELPEVRKHLVKFKFTDDKSE